MHKLLPFRQYDEKDVVNLFALKHSDLTLTTLKPGDDSANKVNWSGAVLKVDSSAANWTADEPGGLHSATHNAESYLGAIGSGDQGPFASKFGSFYPEAPMKLVAAGVADAAALGLALKPTLAYDENDEKLLYYSRKKDELQCSIPGETVPVATGGFFTIQTSGLAVGELLETAANGELTSSATPAGATFGRVLAAGDRSGNGTNDTFFIQVLAG